VDVEVLLVKWLHVLAAIVALGANVTYGVWLALAERDPKSLPFALRGVKALDDRLANPAYIVLLVTGLLMVVLIRFPLSLPWLLTAIILYVLTALIGMLAFSPTLRTQLRLAETTGPDSVEYRRAARRGVRLGALTIVIVVVIVFLMVVKPPLWSA
jgi:uncharacterized membrane protein